MRDARRLVQDLWDIKYAIITLLESVIVEEVGGVGVLQVQLLM